MTAGPTDSQQVTVSTNARVGLLGNPGDGYGGRVLGFTVAELAATVVATPASAWSFQPEDGSELLQAAATELQEQHGPQEPVALSFSTTIPRQVGLSGSSAVIIAALRALLALRGESVGPVALARLALEAETRQMQVTAGPQDRVIQAHGGFMDMDFAQDWDATGYHQLDPALLPDCFIAWDTQTGKDSGALHSTVRTRWDAHDAEVREQIARFRQYATAGWMALRAGDHRALADLLDANFATRAALFKIDASDADKVSIGHAHDAGVKFCGSGGAVVGVPRDPARLADIEAAYRTAGYGFLVPTVPAPASQP